MGISGCAQCLTMSARASFLCEILIKLDFPVLLKQITHFYLHKKTLPIIMCMLFRYEDGQVGDANINTQEARIQREILRVIGTQSS